MREWGGHTPEWGARERERTWKETACRQGTSWDRGEPEGGSGGEREWEAAREKHTSVLRLKCSVVPGSGPWADSGCLPVTAHSLRRDNKATITCSHISKSNLTSH
jgi:hypothetical protein